MTASAHVCWDAGPSCPRCGPDIGQHAALCQCWECREENALEAAERLGY